MTKQTKQEKLEALINSKLKEYKEEQAKDKKRAKKAKRHGRRPPVPKGNIDYKWCDYPTSPKIKRVRNKSKGIHEEYSNGIRVK